MASRVFSNPTTYPQRSGTVSSGDSGGSGVVSVSNFPTIQPVSGSVSVSNFPATQAVSGTFWQATQPVSIAATVAISAAALPLPAGASTEATLAALNTKTPALGQATMTNSRPVVIASNQPALSVTGTFWQATQPVSGTVSVGNFPATQPVSGSVAVSNFPATQPVSIASMPSTPVTGTFWQATQPVSGPLTDVQLRASAVPVSIATLPALPAGANTIGTTLGPSLVKGAQGTTGYSVQNLKDAGRQTRTWTAEFTSGNAAEALLTVTANYDGANQGTTTTIAPTSGKRLRLQVMTLQVEALGTATTPQRAYVRVRINTAGAATVTSPILITLCAGTNTAAVKASGQGYMEFPDGLELLGDGTKTFTFTIETPDYVATTGTVRIKFMAVGFEY